MNDTVHGLPIRLVDEDQELLSLLAQWRRADRISLDTEFVRERTYYPIPGLIQIADGQACYLIDPLGVSSLAPLAALFEEASVLKIMHACSEDLELFDHCIGSLPAPLFDTQIAAAFAGEQLSVGYQRMIEQRLGVHLEKSQTRTDWRRRPLSPEQLHYAAADVAYLDEAWLLLTRELERDGKLAWVQEECGQLSQRRDPDSRADQYQSVSGAWKLKPRQLAALRELHRWRERIAQERDLPRSWLLSDRVLLAIAEAQPRHMEELRAIEGLPRGTLRRHGDRILQGLSAALALPEDELPQGLPKPLSSGQSRTARRLKAVVRSIAGELGVAPELLAKKRDLEQLVLSDSQPGKAQLPAAFSGWREQVLGRRLLSLLAEEAA